jgi:quercetin dioxygenase-like cupin family protein
MKRRTVVVAALIALALTPAALLLAHLGGAHWLAMPVNGDPGISWMVVAETPHYRVLRDFAEPRATRRMRHHADATWHVLTVATGRLKLTVDGEPPVDISAGQSLSLKAGVNHTFTNVGTETATIVEVFGKANP